MELVDKRIHSVFTHYGGVDLSKENLIAVDERDADGNRKYVTRGTQSTQLFKTEVFEHQKGNMEFAYTDMNDLYPGSPENIPNPKNNSDHPKYMWDGEPGNSNLFLKPPVESAFVDKTEYQKYVKTYNDAKNACEERGLCEVKVRYVNYNPDFRDYVLTFEHEGEEIKCAVTIPGMSENRTNIPSEELERRNKPITGEEDLDLRGAVDLDEDEDEGLDKDEDENKEEDFDIGAIGDDNTDDEEKLNLSELSSTETTESDSTQSEDGGMKLE